VDAGLHDRAGFGFRSDFREKRLVVDRDRVDAEATDRTDFQEASFAFISFDDEAEEPVFVVLENCIFDVADFAAARHVEHRLRYQFRRVAHHTPPIHNTRKKRGTLELWGT
jgi:hypothetical protein